MSMASEMHVYLRIPSKALFDGKATRLRGRHRTAVLASCPTISISSQPLCLPSC